MPRGNSKRKPTKRWEEIFGASGFSSSARLVNPGPCFSWSVPASSATVGIEILALKQPTRPHHGTGQVPRWNAPTSAQTQTSGFGESTVWILMLNHCRIRFGFDHLGHCHYDCAVSSYLMLVPVRFCVQLLKSCQQSFLPEPAELLCVCVWAFQSVAEWDLCDGSKRGRFQLI